MLSVEEALEQILSRVQPLPAERVPLMDALWRALAEPIVSGREIPPWPNSSMAGYAVRASDTVRTPAPLTVVGTVHPGGLPSCAVGAGAAVRIFTRPPPPAVPESSIP